MASASLTETGSVYRFRYARVPSYTDNGNGTADITINIYACRQDSDYPFYGRSLTCGSVSGVTVIGFYPDDVPAGSGYENETMDDGEDYLVGYMVVRGTPNSSGNISCSIELKGGGYSFTYGWKYTTSYITSISGISVTTKPTSYSWKSLGSGKASSVSFSLSEYQVGYYLYTPTQNGILEFYTSSNYDTYGGIGLNKINDKDNFTLGTSNSSGSSVVNGTKIGSVTDDIDNTVQNQNFKHSISIEANKTYRIYVHEYNGTPGITGTLYMEFTAPYTVTFNQNGGSAATPATKEVYSGQVYGDLAVTARIGYTFDGWYTAANGGTKITSTTIVNLTGPQTLYAHWTANTFTIIFDANGGNTPNPTTKTVTYDSTYGNLATCTRTGYTFDGWYTAANGGTKITPETKVEITYNNVSFYAHWNKNTYILTLEVGTGISSVSGGGSKKYNDLISIGAVVKNGYTWKNWTTDSGAIFTTTKDYTFYMPATDKTYKANATANTFTVTFNANGGNNLSFNNKTVTYDSTYGTLPTVSKSGYVFEGWYTAINGGTKITSNTPVNITSNQTLYAHWKTNGTVRISINGNMNKKAQAYIFYNGAWHLTQPQTEYNNTWKINGG